MTDEELRRACERAGLEFIPGDPDVGMPDYWHDPRTLDKPMHGGTFGWEDGDPALPAYVASVLVGMVRETLGAERMIPYLVHDANNRDCLVVKSALAGVSDEQRITAAMSVLGDDDG